MRGAVDATGVTGFGSGGTGVDDARLVNSVDVTECRTDDLR
jgi:hypothetical protein